MLQSTPGSILVMCFLLYLNSLLLLVNITSWPTNICYGMPNTARIGVSAFDKPADADYLNNVTTRRSTTGYTISLGGSTVRWSTRQQRSVALSTTEVHCMVMADCSKHVVWFCCLLYILTLSFSTPITVDLPLTKLFNNNKGALSLSEEAAWNSRSKHIDTCHHYIQDIVKCQVIQPSQIDTKAMRASFLTKASGKDVIDCCCTTVGSLCLFQIVIAG